MEKQTELENRKDSRWSRFLNEIEGRFAIKTGLAASLGWTLGSWTSHYLDRPDYMVSGLWCAVTALVVTQLYLGGTYKAAWNRFLGVIVGSFLGGLFTSLFGSHPINLTLGIFSTVVVCSLLGLQDSIRIASLSVTVVMIIWSGHHETSPWKFAFFRALDFTQGIIVAVLLSHVLWPFYATQKLRENMSQIFLHLDRLYRLITQIEMHVNLEEEVRSLKEEILTLSSVNQEVLSEAKVELLTNRERYDKWVVLHDHIENLIELIIALEGVFEKPRKIYSEAFLAQSVSQLINCIDHQMITLSELLLSRQTVDSYDEICELQEGVNQELLKFRETRTTRKYDLEDVEAFFVVFYNLNASVDEIKRILHEVNDLNESSKNK